MSGMLLMETGNTEGREALGGSETTICYIIESLSVKV